MNKLISCNNLAIIGLILILALSLLGCSNLEKINLEFSNSSDVTPFLNDGCYELRPNVYNCDKSKFKQKFNCDGDSEMIDFGLSSKYPLFSCGIIVTSKNSNESKEYFDCNGGLVRSCMIYITYDGNSFIGIKNEKELFEYVGIVDSGVKALNSVSIIKRGSSELIVSGDKVGNLSVLKNGPDYLVTLYSVINEFGCHDKKDYEAIVYKITPDGKIDLVNSDIIYTKNYGAIICTD